MENYSKKKLISRPNGIGRWCSQNCVFEGYIKNEKQFGFGRYFYGGDDGGYYIGLYDHYNGNMKHGEGTLYKSNGCEIYQGLWVDNKPKIR